MLVDGRRADGEDTESMGQAGKIAVSVVIPVYNAQRHLEECLDSCFGQTLKNIEIICVNDGSTDGTEEILTRYARNHDNLYILTQENQGAGVARNRGIRYAKGRFIAFMDSDDCYPNGDVLRKLYAAAIRESVLACGGSAIYLGSEEKELCFKNSGKMYYRDYQKWHGFTRFIYDRKFLVDHKLFFPPYRSNEDPPFFAETMAMVQEFYVISDCVYAIRNTDKIVREDTPAVLLDILAGCGDIIRTARKNQLAELQVSVITLVESSFLSYIYKAIYRGNADIRKRYEELLSELDEELLAKAMPETAKLEAMSDEQIHQLVEGVMEKEKALMCKIKSFKKVLIYGAGKAGRLLYDSIIKRGYIGDIEFMVSFAESNDTACGKKVRSIVDCESYKDDALVLIANKHSAEKMEDNACRYQFKNVERIPYDELMLFGADMENDVYCTIF